MVNQLDISNLTLFRGNKCLFQNINFSLKAGMLILIKGENGSGKTSLLRTIAGLIEPHDGLIEWNNKNINKNRQNYHQNISWLSHKHGFKGHLSIKENFQFESGFWVLIIYMFDIIFNTFCIILNTFGIIFDILDIMFSIFVYLVSFMY